MSRKEFGGLSHIDPLEHRPLTIEDLPPPGTRRWVIRRKAAVIAGVREGLLTKAQACERYSLSLEELRTWEALFEKYGRRGLRVTRLQEYRWRADENKSD